MVIYGFASAVAAALPLSPPGAFWFDTLMGYGSLALLVVLVVRQRLSAADPPNQE